MMKLWSIILMGYVLSIAASATTVDYYLGPVGSGAADGEIDPYVTDANNFSDKIIAKINSSGLKSSPAHTIRLHITGGDYESKPLDLGGVQASLSIIGHWGAGGYPTLFLRTPTRTTGVHDYMVFNSSDWINHFELSGVDLDCEWDQNPFTYPDGYARGGVRIICYSGLIDNVLLRDFGARGGASHTSTGTEVSGLLLITASLGQTTKCEISNSFVYDFYPEAGTANIYGQKFVGYGTCIGIANLHYGYTGFTTYQTSCGSGLGSGQAYYPGCRGNTDLTKAHIHDNYISSVSREITGLSGKYSGAIAIGAGACENLTIEDNYVNYATAGVNVDQVPPQLQSDHASNPSMTPYMGNVLITGNTFNNCNMGVNIGAPEIREGTLQYYTIQNNTIHLAGWWENPTAPFNTNQWPAWEESFAVRLNGGYSNIAITDNTVSAVGSSSFPYPGSPTFWGAFKLQTIVNNVEYFTNYSTNDSIIPFRLVGSLNWHCYWNGQYYLSTPGRFTKGCSGTPFYHSMLAAEQHYGDNSTVTITGNTSQGYNFNDYNICDDLDW